MNKILVWRGKDQAGIARFCAHIEEELSGDHEVRIVDHFSEIIELIPERRQVVAIASAKGWFLPILFPKNFFVLHGFPNLLHYSKFRYFTMIAYFKLMTWISFKTVSVSEFTKLINEAFLGISSDYVVNNDTISLLKTFNGLSKEREVVKILYVGRMLEEKGVYTIIDAFKRVSNKSLQKVELTILGADEDSYDDLNQIRLIQFTDNLAYIHDAYLSSDIFISLNPLEPFGLTALEAMNAGNVLILPETGGHFAFTNNYPHKILCNPNCADQVSAAMLRAIDYATLTPQNSRISDNGYHRDLTFTKLIGELDLEI